MSNIFQHNFNNCDLRLSNSDYWDIFISYDKRSGLNHDVILSGGCLLIDIDANNDLSISGDSICSLVEWSGATINESGVTLNDIGLTGIDNGYIDYPCTASTTGNTFLNIYTGSSLTITSADTKFCMTKVSGCTYEYPVDILSADTIGRYLRFCGGFYQGFFKLSDTTYYEEISDNKFTWDMDWYYCPPDCVTGTTCPDPNKSYECYLSGTPTPYNYQILPTRHQTGWSAVFVLNPDSGVCSGVTATTLNQTYTGNTGFIFYMGTRAENKFWNVFSGETGHTTSSGYPLPPPTVTEEVLNDNPFIVYNGSNWTTGCTFSGITEVTTTNKDWCADVVDNALGFRILDDGSVGYRLVTYSGECSGTSYNTTPIVVEDYSDPGVITNGEWQQLVIRFTPYGNYDSGCDLIVGEKRNGRLDIFVNGLLKHTFDNFSEFIFKELDEHREKQQGVPFNYSLGGGSQGLLETNTIGGPDSEDYSLKIEDNFAGTFIGDMSSFKFYGCGLDVTTIRYNWENIQNSLGLNQNTCN
jgi:hypothetical protein